MVAHRRCLFNALLLFQIQNRLWHNICFVIGGQTQLTLAYLEDLEEHAGKQHNLPDIEISQQYSERKPTLPILSKNKFARPSSLFHEWFTFTTPVYYALSVASK